MKTIKDQRSLMALGIVLAALAALLLIPAAATMGGKPIPDADNDGYTTKDGDCNDNDSSVYPNALELCDGKDNDCDGQIDEGDVCSTPVEDVDEDGWSVAQGDCDDNNPDVNPGATEVCGDGIDNDCDGNIDEGCSGSGLDTDGDGFLDGTEAFGITLPEGLVLAVNGGNYLPPCDGEVDDALCVDASRPDLFVIINRATPSNIPADPLAIMRGFVSADGAPVVPHELEQVDPDTYREIADGQNAVVVNELLDANFGPLGFAPTGGTPNSTSGTVNLYTERIKNEVIRLCGEDENYPIVICDRNGCVDYYDVATCQNEDGSVNTIAGLQTLYIQNVLAHETWHVCALAPPDSAAVILYHFDPNTGWVMEQSIGAKATKAKNDDLPTVTLYISDTFNPESRAKYKLK